ncbi:butyrophilin subfamily 1 member A1-like [Egretta garzetta]|uniref:butyrophilin subfamily 1 member A1-like n=1 Tax=Egretta garzetta TaxID=188379 RepID=UPI00163BB9A7|nr:butyrophilin subfamily 1 member A1-like [Egretta garzetta]
MDMTWGPSPRPPLNASAPPARLRSQRDGTAWQHTNRSEQQPSRGPGGGAGVSPCRYSLEQTARDLDVIWFRENVSPFVHRYKGGQDQYGEQMPQYRGRTELLKDGLNKGHVDLKIFHVQLSDRGSYTYPLVFLPVPGERAQDERRHHLPRAQVRLTGLQLPGSSCRPFLNHLLPSAACRVTQSLWEFCFPDPFFQNARPWMIALGVVLVAVVALLILAVYLYIVKEKQAQELAWRRHAVPITAVTVVLDSDTAHCNLLLSEDCTSVYCIEMTQHVLDNPERFKRSRCVLGCKGFSSGRYYWDVEVAGKGGWFVGVCREDVNREDEIEFKPEEGIWAVGQQGGPFQALTSPERTPFPEIRTPKRIRVSLDYEEGWVAFFIVDKKIPVFIFPLASFEGKRVFPWFWGNSWTYLRMVPC